MREAESPEPRAHARRDVLASGGALTLAGLFGGLFGGNAARAQDGAVLPNYPAQMDDAAIDAVFGRATAEVEAKTAAAVAAWAMNQSRWDADLEAGTLTFTNPRGWRIVAPVQVVGTRNTADGTFLWGWDHPSVPVPLRADAERVRAFGAAQGGWRC